MNFFLLILLFFIAIKSQINENKRIAIIGSGIGGTSLIHYLQSIFEDVDISLFEKSSRIGGRTHSIDIQNKTYEIGATFICDTNKKMMELIKHYDLKFKEKKSLNIGFWRDNQFKFKL